MSLVDAYDTKTGKRLPYLVPEEHFDHPVLGDRIARLPSQRSEAVLDDVKGDALDEALEAAKLPKTGTAKAKRERLAAHLADPTDPATDPGDGHTTPAVGDTEN